MKCLYSTQNIRMEHRSNVTNLTKYIIINTCRLIWCWIGLSNSSLRVELELA